MEFKKAEQLLIKNKHIIGKQVNGAAIDELILVPTNVDSSVDFFRLYRQSLDGKKSIQPFIGSDVDIIAVFNKKHIAQSFFFHKNIYDLPANIGAVIE